MGNSAITIKCFIFTEKYRNYLAKSQITIFPLISNLSSPILNQIYLSLKGICKYIFNTKYT